MERGGGGCPGSNLPNCKPVRDRAGPRQRPDNMIARSPCPNGEGGGVDGPRFPNSNAPRPHPVDAGDRASNGHPRGINGAAQEGGPGTPSHEWGRGPRASSARRRPTSARTPAGPPAAAASRRLRRPSEGSDRMRWGAAEGRPTPPSVESLGPASGRGERDGGDVPSIAAGTDAIIGRPRPRIPPILTFENPEWGRCPGTRAQNTRSEYTTTAE